MEIPARPAEAVDDKLQLGWLIGPWLRPRNGIAARNPFAPYELCLVMMPVIMRIRGTRLGVQLSIHMGTISWCQRKANGMSR